MKPAAALLAAALAASIGTAAAAERAELVDRSALRVCADPAAPPLSSRDVSGYENRIAELLAHDLGVPVRYTWFPSGMGFYRNTLNLRRCDVVIGTVTGIDAAQTTIPYYRSAYVLVTRAADKVAAAGLSDPSLQRLVIGAQAGSPAIDALQRQGLLDRLRAYTLTSDGSAEGVGRRMIDDLAARRIDGAVLWGPIGAYFADLRPGAFRLVPLAHGSEPSPLAFDIGMAVRFGEARWRARIEQFIRHNRAALQQILAAAHVPLLPLAAESGR